MFCKIIFSLAFFFSLPCLGACAFPGYDATGLENLHGKELLPCKFRSIFSVSENFILADIRNPDNPLDTSLGRKLFNKDLKEIELKLPPNCKLYYVILPKEISTSTTKALPAKTLIMIQKGTQYGLCDMHGKIILEPIYPRFPPPDGKFLYVTDGRHKTEFVMDLETGKRNFLPPNTQLIRGGSTDLLPILFNGPHKEQAGYASPAGVVVIEPKFVRTETFSSNDLAKVRFFDRITESEKEAFIDKTGKIVSPSFDQVQAFEDGVSVISIRKENSTLLGLMDNRFKVVVSPTYFQLQRVAPGIFAAKSDKHTPWTAINLQGKQIFEFPKDMMFARDGGKTADGKNLILCHLYFSKEPSKSENVFLTLNGKEFLKLPNTVSRFENGKATSNRWNAKSEKHELVLIDETGAELGPAPMFEQMKTLNHIPQYKLKVLRDFKFSKEAWKKSSEQDYYPRFGLLDTLLREYDLIGMKRLELIELLGGNGTGYAMNGGVGCGNSRIALCFEYNLDDTVKRWRLITGTCNDSCTWFDTNVVFKDPNYFYEIGRLSNVYPTVAKYPKKD